MQMSADDLAWKESWVTELWEQAREEVVRRSPGVGTPQSSQSGYSIAGFEQAFQQEASMSGPRHYTMEE